MIVTVDIDWAPESAIEETLETLLDMGVTPTCFSTHNSKVLESYMNRVEVGLHPFFGKGSSHGETVAEVVKSVSRLPHNLPAYRCHRFQTCNASSQAMLELGMRLSSNVCTDLEVVPPFRNRFGILEVPLFFEDGGYLWRKHSLEMDERLLRKGTKVLLVHPMHFVLNTPQFEFMAEIKRSTNREEWIGMRQKRINELRWKGRGIRNLVVEWLQLASSKQTTGQTPGQTLGSLLRNDEAQRSLEKLQPELQS